MRILQIVILMTAFSSGYAQVTLVNTGGTHLKSSGTLYLVAEDVRNEGTISAEEAIIRLTGDWHNSGTFNYGTGMLVMNGKADQQLDHNGSLYNLVINSKGQVKLIKSIIVNNRIDFGEGNLITEVNNTVTLAESAMLLNETEDSYLIGNVQMTTTVNGTSSGFGNIGATLDARGQNLGEVTITRSAGLSQQGISYGVSPANADIKSIDRVYAIASENKPALDVAVTFAWNAANNNGNTDLSEMQVWQEVSEWTGLGQFENGNDYQVAAEVSSLGRFTIGPDLAALFQALFQADSVCFGNKTTFTDLSSTYGSNVQYAWDLDGDGITDNTTAGNVSFNYEEIPDNKVTLTISNDEGKTDTYTFAVTVHALPTVDAGADMTINVGETVRLQPIASADVVSYEWSPGSYLDEPQTEAPLATPLEDITYLLTVINANGCQATDDLEITLEELFIPTGFTPDGDGTNDVWKIPDLDNFSNANISIFDRSGRKIYQNSSSVPWDGTYNGKASPSGTYFYIIDLGNGMDKLRGEVSIIKMN